MKSLLSALSNQQLFAVSVIVCLLPFAHRDFVEALSPVAAVGASVVVFLLCSILILPLLDHKFRPAFSDFARHRWIVALMAAWLLLMALSVLAADTNRLSGVYVLGMTVVAFELGWFAFALSGNSASRLKIVRALGISALIIIIFAACEGLNLRPISPWLATFHGNATFDVVERISSLLNHPNIMAAYLELTLPFVLIWLLLVRQLWRRVLLAIVLVGGAIVLVHSLSRGGIFSFSAALISFGIVAFFVRQRLFALICAALVGVIVLTIIAQVLADPRIQVRYLSEDSNDLWYRAVYHAPTAVQAELGQVLHLSLSVQNTSLFEWETEGDQPVNLGYHIICRGANTSGSLAGVDLASLKYLTAASPRAALPGKVAEGETATVQVTLAAPTTPGRYLIAWDMVQESVTWFSNKGLTPATTALDVAGVAPVSSCAAPAYVQAAPPDAPLRLDLWQTALRIVRTHPVLGIGARNFDAYYAQYHAAAAFNPPHPHNLYLALLVDYGVFSGVFIIIAVFLLVRMLIRAKPSVADRRGWIIWLGVGVGLLSFGLHSMVDSFFYQPSILVTVCIIVGLTTRFAVENQR